MHWLDCELRRESGLRELENDTESAILVSPTPIFRGVGITFHSKKRPVNTDTNLLVAADDLIHFYWSSRKDRQGFSGYPGYKDLDGFIRDHFYFLHSHGVQLRVFFEEFPESSSKSEEKRNVWHVWHKIYRLSHR